ncbi:hypothetical protein PENTCL1PPCAC_3032, partial [Pristionchus entomophagus]
MAVRETRLSTVEGWKTQHIQRSLEALDIELSIFRRSEKNKEPSVRSLTYGLMESLHLALLQLTEEGSLAKYSEDASKQTHQIPIFAPFPLIEPKEEPIDIDQSIPYYNEMSSMVFIGDDTTIKEEEMPNDGEDRMDNMDDEVFNKLLNESPSNNDIVDEPNRTVNSQWMSR